MYRKHALTTEETRVSEFQIKAMTPERKLGTAFNFTFTTRLLASLALETVARHTILTIYLRLPKNDISMPLAPNSPSSSLYTIQRIQKSPSIGELSIIQRSSTTIEVCGHDTTFPSFLDTSEYFYDSHAGACSHIFARGDYLTTEQCKLLNRRPSST